MMVILASILAFIPKEAKRLIQRCRIIQLSTPQHINSSVFPSPVRFMANLQGVPQINIQHKQTITHPLKGIDWMDLAWLPRTMSL